MKIEKYVVILSSENGDKTHLKMSVNREKNEANICLAEGIKLTNGVLYAFGNKITKQPLKHNKNEYKVRVYAEKDIDLLLLADGRGYAGSTGRTPKIKALKALAERCEFDLESQDRTGDEPIENKASDIGQIDREKQGQVSEENSCELTQEMQGNFSTNFGQKNDEEIAVNYDEKIEENFARSRESFSAQKCSYEAEQFGCQKNENDIVSQQSNGEVKDEEAKIFSFDSVQFDGSNFYLSVKPQIDEIFVCYPEEDTLNNLVPNSRWVRINTSDGYYVVGLVLDGDTVSYICYGVPSTDKNMPPVEIADFAVWLSDGGEEGRGYWLIYQDALTGKCLR